MDKEEFALEQTARHNYIEGLRYALETLKENRYIGIKASQAIEAELRFTELKKNDIDVEGFLGLNCGKEPSYTLNIENYD